MTSPAPRDLWEEVLTSDPNALPFHAPRWLDCVCAYDGEDASRHYQLPSGRQLVVPMVRRGRGPLATEASLPGDWHQGGVIATGGVQVEDVATVFSDLAGRSVIRTSLRPGPLDGEIWAAARPPGAIGVPRSAHVIELVPDFEQVWSTFDRHARKHVRKAERSGLTVERDTSGRLVPVLHELFERSIDRFATQQHEPLALARLRYRRMDLLRKLELIARTQGESCHIWVAWHQGRPAAANLVLQGKHTSCLRGFMDKEVAGPTRANYLLHKLAIEEACAAGCRYYDFGESGTSESLASFKSQFGARALPYAEYHLERVPISACERRVKGLVKRVIGFRD